jgi:hypothetical protein
MRTSLCLAVLAAPALAFMPVKPISAPRASCMARRAGNPTMSVQPTVESWLMDNTDAKLG